MTLGEKHLPKALFLTPPWGWDGFLFSGNPQRKKVNSIKSFIFNDPVEPKSKMLKELRELLEKAKNGELTDEEYRRMDDLVDLIQKERRCPMSLELEQAIQAAKRNDLQEAIIKLCEAVRQLENEISYLQSQ